ncbi:glycosyltransferase family 4 protein [Gramella jeungdoensis]|uniref:Glycosyltransferase family 4 protein n=1 Tax=Gramella jeungdoensis TaxID=708091 RepID=A0ABT0Z353_9FLAO|nr:glycosyltransferase family 4 protein [Gramella jeungdoensis]MCM8570156.1 glycosyltransferase family 4 protein [Gramella jeungdoensis]
MSRVLVIGYVWPEPTSSAAGTRMMQLLKFFRNDGYEVLFSTTTRETENKADLDSIGIRTEKIKLNDPEFDKLLEEFQPDMVLFDRFMMEEQFGWRVDNMCPKAIKILDTEDLHFLRKAREIAYKKNEKAEKIYFNSDLTKREIAAIYRCDLSLIISEAEMKLLLSEFRIPKEILLYLPYLIENISESEYKDLPDFEERNDFISIGNFLHEPNWNAVLYIKEKIWPQIRKKLPEAKMQIYGAYATEKVYNLHDEKSGFIVNGQAEDSSEVMQKARICLAPIRFGAGLKGKLIEAMQNGTPSVTTSIGAEGINSELSWNGFIADSENEFIARAVELYSEKNLWRQKQITGFEIINSRFSKEQFESNLKSRLEEIKNNIVAHRRMNFTGEMLKHHLHKSTYFMSRFIEEKNRNRN